MIPFSGFQILVLRKLQTIYDLIVSSPPGSTTWGTITGLLANQTDLQNALNAKFDDPTGTTSDYIRGDGSIAAFPTTSGIPHGNATAAVPDTYTTTITGVTAYNDADAYLIRFTTGNTTSATLNINSIGPVDLYRNNNGPLIGGDIIDGAEMLCIYNSTTNRFQVIGTAPNTLLAYVTNAESIAITKGQPVYAFGGQGDRLTVKLASNSTDATSAQTVGLVVSTSIAANQKGLIMVNGLLDGLSTLPTSTFADGDAIYLGATAGTITNVKPFAPNHLVYLGFVTSASPGGAGRMYIRVQNGYELQELHNVQAQSPSLKDTLYYDNGISPGQWKTASISTILGYTPQQQLSLTTTGTSGAATLVGSTLNIPQYSGGSSVSKSILIGNHGASTVGAGATSYGGFVKNNLTTAAQAFNVRTVMPTACVFRNWSVNIGTQPATGSCVFTMQIDAVDTAYTLTISAGSVSGVYQNTISSLSVANLSQITYKITNNAATSTGAVVAVSIQVEI